MAEAAGTPDRAVKRKLSKFVTRRLVNPVVRSLLERGIAPRSHALLETVGRTSGLPRRVPVGNGLRGDTFWIVTEHGYAADYVRNIQRNPRVRVKVGLRWRDGTAHLLPEDDVAARLRLLRRPLNDAIVRLVGTEHLTIRVDLDPLTD
jgi:deazaflavin-dependent oxidoreductase (nitroreductase family)